MNTGLLKLELPRISRLQSYINRIIKKSDGGVTKTLVNKMETLGYDIELVYIKCE